MKQTIAALINTLTKEFVELEAQLLKETQEWAAGRRAALTVWKQGEGKEFKHNAHEYYARAFVIMGGKTWYQMQNGRSAADCDLVIAKVCAEAAAARIAKITKSLLALGVEECELVEAQSGGTTADGVYKMVTNLVPLSVTISTIYAGGYNIQCAHM